MFEHDRKSLNLVMLCDVQQNYADGTRETKQRATPPTA
jgi:hypothetical protein